MRARRYLPYAFLCLLLLAAPRGSAQQSSGSSPSADKPPASQPAASKPAKRKKVWTEDDMGKLTGPVSVVGSANSPSPAPLPQTPAPAAKDANSYRQRMVSLRAELQQIEDKRRDIQTSKLGGRENIQRMLDDLDAKKKDVLGKMDALEEQARKEGIDSGQFR